MAHVGRFLFVYEYAANRFMAFALMMTSVPATCALVSSRQRGMLKIEQPYGRLAQPNYRKGTLLASVPHTVSLFPPLAALPEPLRPAWQ